MAAIDDLTKRRIDDVLAAFKEHNLLTSGDRLAFMEYYVKHPVELDRMWHLRTENPDEFKALAANALGAIGRHPKQFAWLLLGLIGVTTVIGWVGFIVANGVQANYRGTANYSRSNQNQNLLDVKFNNSRR